MPDVDLGFPRSWVEFAHPDDPTERFRCDLTWLTSRWTCIFGAGCAGIDAARPDAGCCALGAHFADAADHERVAAVVEDLGPDAWHHRAEGLAGGWTETDADGDLKTRTVEGACIFHNPPGSAAGYGCALHGHALRRGMEPHTTKPDVCWQLPLRRQFREVDEGDGDPYTEVTIGEYVRAGWGPGGADLDWYCSSNTEAHVASEPVWLAHAAELTALMGPAAYAELSRHCAAFVAAGIPVPHPATVGTCRA